jgi:hypothetical protein
LASSGELRACRRYDEEFEANGSDVDAQCDRTRENKFLDIRLPVATDLGLRSALALQQ